MNSIRNDSDIEDLLIKSGALLKGHFILSSGLHSDIYVQCAKFFQYPEMALVAARKLAEYYYNLKVDLVIGGAFGGIIIAYELARVLHARGIFAERLNGKFALRRGFSIQPNENVLIAEDVITTGGSVSEIIDLVNYHRGNIIGVASLIDRNMKQSENLGVRVEWLHTVQANTYQPAECPLCQEGKLSPVKPGSRGIN